MNSSTPAGRRAGADLLASFAALAVATTALLTLAGCGGADGVAEPAATTTPPKLPEAVATPALQSLPDYLAQRSRPSTTPGLPAPSSAELASIADVSRARAVAQLASALAPRGNAMVVPPLSFAYANVLTSAARGATLAQVLARYPAELGPWAAAAQTQGVQRRLWAPRGTGFLPAFLAASDVAGGTAAPSLAGWAAAEVADWSDPSYWQSLTALNGGLPAAGTPGSLTRLVVADALTDALDWPAASTFDGTYATERGGTRLRLPMLRINTGVKRLLLPDFVIDAVTVGQRTLLKLEPREGLLYLAGGEKLNAALAQAMQALIGPGRSSLADASLVLPVLTVKLPGQSASDVGLPLAFDEINADLRGFDGGGSYLKVGNAETQLTLGASGLSVSAAHKVEFVFSTKNVFVPDYGYGVVVTSTNSGSSVVQIRQSTPACPQPESDLRSFFLAVLDAQKRVISLSALAELNGDVCL